MPAWSMQHRFIAGLGFRTRWTYRAFHGRERWLPVGHELPAAVAARDDGGWIAAQQVAALLLGSTPPQPQKRAWHLDEQALVDLLRTWMPSTTVESGAFRTASDEASGDVVFALVAERLAAGELVLLRHAVGQRSPRWSLVSGVELATWASHHGVVGRKKDRVSALLLLDSQAAPVWGCGYSVRLEAVPGRILRRTLDGGLAQVHVMSWLCIGTSAPKP